MKKILLLFIIFVSCIPDAIEDKQECECTVTIWRLEFNPFNNQIQDAEIIESYNNCEAPTEGSFIILESTFIYEGAYWLQKAKRVDCENYVQIE